MKQNLIVFTILLLSITIQAFNFEGARIKNTEPIEEVDESQFQKPEIKAAAAPKKPVDQYEETSIVSKDSKQEANKADHKKAELQATETPEIKKAQGEMESTSIVNKLGEEKNKQLEAPEMIRMNKVHAGKTELKRSKFGTYLMKQTAKRPYVSGYIDTYLQDGYSYRYEEKYSYSANFAYLPKQYGPWVTTIIQDVCICRWPLPIRYLVFPRIYGFYEDEKILVWLEELYAMGEPEAIVETMMSGLTPEEEEMRNDLIEQLASYQHIKSMVDENLTEQSEKILDAEKLKDSISEEFNDILEQYQDLIGDDEFLADEELGIDDIIDFLKDQVKDSEKSEKKDKDADTDWKKQRQQKMKAAKEKRKERRHKRHAHKAAQKKMAKKMKLANLKKAKAQREALRAAKTQHQTEAKTEVKHEAKAEVKHETKHEAKHQAKHQVKHENKEKKVEVHPKAATLLHAKKN